LVIYPAVYDPQRVPEAGTTTTRLGKVAPGTLEAYTSTSMWKEVTWVVRRLFDSRKAGASARVLEGYLTRMLAAICVELDSILEMGKRGF